MSPLTRSPAGESATLDAEELHRWVRLAPATQEQRVASKTIFSATVPSPGAAEKTAEVEETGNDALEPRDEPEESQKEPADDEPEALPPEAREAPAEIREEAPRSVSEADGGSAASEEEDQPTAVEPGPELSQGEEPEHVDSEGETDPPPSEDEEVLRSRYLQRLVPNIRGQYFYPQMARRLGLEGRVLVALEIDAQGKVVSVRLHRSSGHAPLDEGAVTALRRLSQLPPPHPQLLEDGHVEVIVPMNYSLSGGNR